jgi:hypothetical protein
MSMIRRKGLRSSKISCELEDLVPAVARPGAQHEPVVASQLVAIQDRVVEQQLVRLGPHRGGVGDFDPALALPHLVGHRRRVRQHDPGAGLRCIDLDLNGRPLRPRGNGRRKTEQKEEEKKATQTMHLLGSAGGVRS